MRKLLAFVAITAAALSGCDYSKVLSDTLPCSQWTIDQDTHGPNAATEVGWAYGFFPAFYKSAAKRNTLEFPAANKKLLADMNEYCRQHPQATMTDAATEVMLAATGLQR